MTLMSRCPDCQGTGWNWDATSPCARCHGAGTIEAMIVTASTGDIERNLREALGSALIWCEAWIPRDSAFYDEDYERLCKAAGRTPIPESSRAPSAMPGRLGGDE